MTFKLFPNQARRWPNRSLSDRYHYWTLRPRTGVPEKAIRLLLWIEESVLYRVRHPFSARTPIRTRPDRAPCRHCGTRTYRRAGHVDPKTLQRKISYECEGCAGINAEADAEARERRRKLDWRKITTPIRSSAIVPESMGEQYPGRVREALRAFESSGAEIATVPGVDAGSLNTSIAALSLSGQMYAEQRGKETVLRRVPVDEVVAP